MSDTPRTDAKIQELENVEDSAEESRAFARQLERELSELQLKFMDQSSEVLELRKDKERLDWLLNQDCNGFSEKSDGRFAYYGGWNQPRTNWFCDKREAIDEAMEAADND